MMTLTYIFHSCFALETDRCILIFDYWADPADILSKSGYLSGGKPVYVFASHFHEDHFNKAIFKWRDDNPHTHYTYLLSKDILRHRRAKKEEADAWLAKGSHWADDNIKVTATGSNDSGVSWVVECDGKRIFHAGDLCNWYARFLTDDDSACEAFSEELGTYVNPRAEEKRFLGELKDIRKVTDTFDIAMFPIDGRIGNGYTLGARQLMERFKVGLLVPMHFVMSGFESVRRMEPFCTEKGVPFWCMEKEGESTTLIDPVRIRRTSTSDLPRLQEIFAAARRFMRATGNPHQWADDYPSKEQILDDIACGGSHVCLLGDSIVATFVLREGDDPTYSTIYEGAWPNDSPYATLHRIASDGTLRGVFHKVTQFATLRHDNIRIDTHLDNKVMQRAICKEGFKYCGVIHCWNGGSRLAYQLTRE